MSSPNTAPVPVAHPAIDPKGMRVIWLLLIAAFVAILNETTMGIAIPHLNRDLGIPPELGQWLTSAFMLSMAVVIPTTGFLLQRFTTRQVFIAAATAFSFGTLVCLLAPGFIVLLLGRVIQALGTGVMIPLLMTTMMNVVPPQSRGRMMGRVGLVISLAPAIGPTLSGFILDVLSWRWLFGIILPIALLSLAFGLRWMTNLGETRKAPLDVLSVVLSAVAFGSIVYGLSQFGAGHGDADTSAAPDGASPVVLGIVLMVVGAVGLALFVWRQLLLQREDRALLDLRVLLSRNYTVATIIMGIIALAMFGTLTLLPQYLQNVVGLEAMMSGLILLPGAVIMGLLGPVMGRIYDAQGPRVLLVPGTIIVTLSLIFYTTVSEHTSWMLLIAVQTAMSIALAMCFTPLFSASLGSLPKSLYSHGSAALNTLQQVGGAAGVAIMLGLYSSILHSGEAEGLSVAEAGAPGVRAAFLVAAIVAACAALLSVLVHKPKDSIPEVEAAGAE